MVEVVAALIEQNGKFLICQRPANKGNALLWEFAGGKAEAGESITQALIRECREELDITVSVGEVFFETEHIYPDIHVHLTLFKAEIAAGTLKTLEHNDIKWVTVSEMQNFNFCPADAGILQKIKEVYHD